MNELLFQNFFLGVLIGVIITVIMFASLILFGNMKLEINPLNRIDHFLFWTLAFIPLAYMEELAFRSYPLFTLNKHNGLWMSLLITSLLFALYHLVNGWSFYISLLGPGVWGLVYGIAAIYSNGIALPTGLHYACNLVLTSIGMKEGFTSIWILTPLEEQSPVHSSENVGYLIQIALLLLSVIFIEWYRRKRIGKVVRMQRI